ncbi:MAG: hypothetical protein EZS28_014175 [Streblomastix strix]|uniref:Protein kinase domain-containing protein n=1 Tax=Streblomastix strix TaxID=222440 RepID=A0A5J4W750_9EUKA|nr:MAG: hypothetical protein EZS28_014175 [Streblomastix strix]
MDYERIIRGDTDSPSSVYLCYDLTYGFVAVKIISKDKFDIMEWDMADILRDKGVFCPFILKYQIYFLEWDSTLDIIAKQPQIPLPSYTFRALMKQILEGIRVFHTTGLIHRDIKCDNILLHRPPGQRYVHAKISDFGLTKQEDVKSVKNYHKGTLYYMAPELFHFPIKSTQKADLYAVGITFYHIITHLYPVVFKSIEEYSIYFNRSQFEINPLQKPTEIKDNLLWDLLSKLLEYDSMIRITAVQALQHPYFTSAEALCDISSEQQEIASETEIHRLNGEDYVSIHDINPSYIVSESPIIILGIFTSEDHRKISMQKGLIKLIERLIQHNPKQALFLNVSDIIKRITCQIFRYIGEGSTNPLLKELYDNGVLTIIQDVFTSSCIQNSEMGILASSNMIGYLFKAHPLPSEFVSDIIKHLKILTFNHNLVISFNSLLALSFLAECQLICAVGELEGEGQGKGKGNRLLKEMERDGTLQKYIWIPLPEEFASPLISNSKI